MFKLIKGSTLLMLASTFFVFANNEIATNNPGDQAQAEKESEKNKKLEDEKEAQTELDKQQAENNKKNNPGKVNLS